MARPRGVGENCVTKFLIFPIALMKTRMKKRWHSITSFKRGFDLVLPFLSWRDIFVRHERRYPNFNKSC